MDADDEVILEVTWETSSKVFARLKVPPAATLRNIHDALVSKRAKLDETEFVYLFHGKPVFREFWEVFTADNFDGSLIMRKGVIVLGLDGSQATEDEWNPSTAKTPRMTISQVKAPPKLPDDVKPKEIPPSPMAGDKEKEKAPYSPYSGGVLPSKPAPSVTEAILRKEREREESKRAAKKSAADTSPIVPDLKKYEESKKAPPAKKADIKVMDIDIEDDGEITEEEEDLPPEVSKIVEDVGVSAITPAPYAPPSKKFGGGVQLPGMGAAAGPTTPKGAARASKKPEPPASAFAAAAAAPTTPKYPSPAPATTAAAAPAPAAKATSPATTGPPSTGSAEPDDISDTGSGAPAPGGAKKVQALYNYKARSADQLSFGKGDQMEILIFRPKGKWWFAKLNDKKGWIPYNFVQVLE